MARRPIGRRNAALTAKKATPAVSKESPAQHLADSIAPPSKEFTLEESTEEVIPKKTVKKKRKKKTVSKKKASKKDQ